MKRWIRGEFIPTVEIPFGFGVIELVFPFWKIVALAALAAGWIVLHYAFA